MIPCVKSILETYSILIYFSHGRNGNESTGIFSRFQSSRNFIYVYVFKVMMMTFDFFDDDDFWLFRLLD